MHVLFGTTFQQFGTFATAYMTLFRYVIGDFDTDELVATSWLAIPLFVLFMLLFYLIFVNLYLATMMANYANTVSEMDIERVKDELNRGSKDTARPMSFLQKGFSTVLGAGPLAKKILGSSDDPTVNSWKDIAAVMVMEQQMAKYASLDADDPDASDDEAEGEVLEDDDDEGGARKEDVNARQKGDYLRDMLFSRVGDARVVQLAADEEPHPTPSVDHLDDKELVAHLADIDPTGEEFWLDTLVTHIERMSSGDQLLTQCFMTEEMRASGSGASGQLTKEQQTKEFDRTAMLAFKALEVKARMQYYLRVAAESDLRQQRIRKQCDVVHAYAVELEKAYGGLLEQIAVLEDGRQELTTCIEGILPQAHHMGATGQIVEV
jgi:hypothetical protein